MLLAQNTIRERLKGSVEKLAENGVNDDVKAAAQEYLDTFSVRRNKRNSYRQACRSSGRLRLRMC